MNNNTGNIVRPMCGWVGMVALAFVGVWAFLVALGAWEVLVDGVPVEKSSGCGRLFGMVLDMVKGVM